MKKSLLSLSFMGVGCISLSTSCVRDTTLDAGENPQIVVDCILSDDDVQELYICFTKGASKKEAESLTEAVATLIDLTESNIVGQFAKGKEENMWTLDYSAIPQHSYRLEVQVSGYDLVYAEDVVPERVDIESFTLTENYLENGGFGLPSPTFTSNVLCAGTVYRCHSLPEHTLIYGMNYNRQIGRHEIADEIFTNLPIVDDFNITGDVYIPELYKYEDPNLPGADAVRSLYADLKGAYKHKQYLLLEKDKMDKFLYQHAEDPDDMVDYDFMVYGSFSGDWYHYKRKDFREPAPTEGYLVFESLSDNYLAYIRDALYVMQLKESTDMSSIYLRDNIHTNVVGGLGIFAASVRQIQQCANIFRTEIVAEQFLDYGIISENGEYRFADNERYEYPLINPDEWLVKCFAELHPSRICETANVNN